MKAKTIRRHRSRFMALVAFAAVGVLLAAAPAYADTSQSSATALHLTGLIAGQTTSTTASNDGTQPTVDNVATPLITLLPAAVQTIVNVGVLTQEAVARADGTSAACAGAAGSAGIVSVGGPNGCSISDPATTGGVSVKVGVLTVLNAGAIIAGCSANSAGVVTGYARFVNASAVNGLLTVPLLDNPAPNSTPLNLALVKLEQNVQVTNPDGSLSVTALRLSVLGSTQVVNIGEVTCGPNAATSPISSFPTKGLPIAGGIVALAGGAVYIRRRHTNATRTAA